MTRGNDDDHDDDGGDGDAAIDNVIYERQLNHSFDWQAPLYGYLMVMRRISTLLGYATRIENE